MSTRAIAAVVVAAGAVVLCLALARVDEYGGFGVARRPAPVPDVVGMTVAEAHLALGRRGYGCAVVAEGDDRGAGPRMVMAQEEEPGSEDPPGQIVRLTVSKPYPRDARFPRDPREGLLPPNCVDARGGYGRPH